MSFPGNLLFPGTFARVAQLFNNNKNKNILPLWKEYALSGPKLQNPKPKTFFYCKIRLLISLGSTGNKTWILVYHSTTDKVSIDGAN